jgi:hypothetical protein
MRPKRRKPRKGKHLSGKARDTFLSVTTSVTPEKYQTRQIREENPGKYLPGISFRCSSRWFVSHDLPVMISVPYVSVSGKFSIYRLYKWKTTPARCFASVVSTVYSRIQRILRTRFGYRRAQCYSHASMKVAICYTITHDDSIIDRFLGMTRKGTPVRSVYNLVHFWVCRLDDDKRFVYGQAWQQANWLKFLGKPRDKSSTKGETSKSHLNRLSAIWGIPRKSFLNPVSFGETVKFLRNQQINRDTSCLGRVPLDLASLRSETSGFGSCHEEDDDFIREFMSDSW